MAVIEALVPSVAVVLVAVIEALATIDRRKDKKQKEELEKHLLKEKEEAAEKEKCREETIVLMLQSTRAAINLGVATAHALQAGHTNGDVDPALEFAKEVKARQKDFFTKLGVHNIWD